MRKRTLATFGFVLLVFLCSKGSIRAAGKAAEPNEFLFGHHRPAAEEPRDVAPAGKVPA